MHTFDRHVLSRVPLAEATLVVARWALDHETLDRAYEDHRGRCHTRVLSFTEFVQLLFDCLTRPWHSARAGLLTARADGRLPVSLTAFYDKLKHTPLAVARGLFRATAGRLRQVVPTEHPDCPASLRGVSCLLLDGKVVKHVRRRLTALRRDRDTACRLLGPRALVVADRWTGLLLDVELDLDGEANEVKYAPALVEHVRQTVKGDVLIVGDRAFGVFKVCAAIAEQGGDFLVRQHGQTTFRPDPTRPAVDATDRFGRPVHQQWGWITRGTDTADGPAERIEARQIVVKRATESLVLLTSRLDPVGCPVEDLLDTYLARWDIENTFQQVTEVFHLRHLFSSSPGGMAMQLVLAFVLYNVVRVVKQCAAAASGKPEPTISSTMLFRDVQEELIALSKLVPAESVVGLVPGFQTPAAVLAHLRRLLAGRWCERWTKANRRPRDPSRPAKPKPTRVRQTKSHDSVYRILQNAKK